MRFRFSLLVPAVAAVAAFAWTAHAGGPFVVDEVGKTGVAQRWQNNALTYSIDKGDLATGYDNAEGVALVQEMIAKWVDVTLENPDREGEEIDTTVFSASVQSQPAEDITVDNYDSALSTSNTSTYIIFDPNGAITEDLGYDKDSVVGLSQPLASDSSGLSITKGVVILNGYLLDDNTLTLNQFKAAVLHELGHLINLDHTQVNYDAIKNCSLGKSCGYNYAVPTMYPILVSELQATLKIDDKITVSWIYPKVDDASQKFNPNYGAITGAIFDADGQPLKGVNVIAMLCDTYDEANDTCYTATDPDLARVDVRSMVSGVLYPEYYGDSKYYLYGLLPGHKFKVVCESIASQFTGASGFEPIPNPPQGISDCNIESPDGSVAPVTVESAGQLIEMASKTIDVTNPCPESICGDSGSGGSSSSKCSLLPVGEGAAGELAFLAVALAAIGLRRRWGKG